MLIYILSFQPTNKNVRNRKKVVLITCEMNILYLEREAYETVSRRLYLDRWRSMLFYSCTEQEYCRYSTRGLLYEGPISHFIVALDHYTYATTDHPIITGLLNGIGVLIL